jgi:hypothetical protein
MWEGKKEILSCRVAFGDGARELGWFIISWWVKETRLTIDNRVVNSGEVPWD